MKKEFELSIDDENELLEACWRARETPVIYMPVARQRPGDVRSVGHGRGQREEAGDRAGGTDREGRRRGMKFNVFIDVPAEHESAEDMTEYVRDVLRGVVESYVYEPFNPEGGKVFDAAGKKVGWYDVLPLAKAEGGGRRRDAGSAFRIGDGMTAEALALDVILMHPELQDTVDGVLGRWERAGLVKRAEVERAVAAAPTEDFSEADAVNAITAFRRSRRAVEEANARSALDEVERLRREMYAVFAGMRKDMATARFVAGEASRTDDMVNVLRDEIEELRLDVGAKLK